MAQYMLAVHGTEDQTTLSEEQIQKMYADVDVFNEKVKAAGAWIFAGGLHPSSTATVVRIEGGKAVTTDGPFAETKEQLGGLWIIEAADLDAALAWAEGGSRACGAPVEVRPFQEVPETAHK